MNVLRMVLIPVLAQSLMAAPAHHRRAKRPMRFTATAFSVRGTTASGNQARPWTAAADPSVLPLGTHVRIRGAGRYSGEYTVTDTGPKVNGHRIDLFIESAAEAKRFGRKTVGVQVVKAAR